MKTKRLLSIAVTATLLAGAMGFADPPTPKKITTIAEFGKSVDWHPKLDCIASAKIGEDGYYDVFTMKSDGSEIKTLTHALLGCPQKHNGNPCFHPSGKFLVFTGQNEWLPDKDKAVRKVTIPGSGLGANLFLVGIDGRTCHQLTKYPLARPIRAVIHPQFSKNGKRLAWAERVLRGDSFGGGWVIKVADFVGGDSPCLKGTRTLKPGEQDCFYETHDFSGDGKRLLFSGNLQKGQPHTGLDIYEMGMANGKTTRLTHTDTDWDEHAHYSPDGERIAWMSSTGLDIDYGPDKGQGTTWRRFLKTELWIMDADGSNAQQLTHFNIPGYPENIKDARCIVSDSTWAPDGKSICVCVAWVKGRKTGVKLVKIEL